MTLRWRFALVLAAASALLTFIAGIGALWNTGRALTQETDRLLAERIAALPPGVIDQIVRLGSSERPAELPGIDRDSPFRGRDGRQPLFSPDVLIQVVDAEGRPVVTIERAPRLDIPAELIGGSGSGYADTEDGDAVYRVVSTPTSTGGSLVLGRDVTEDAAIIEELRRRIVLLGVALAGAAAAAGWFIAGRTIEPIRLLNDAAHQVAQTQDLSAPIAIDRKDEVGELARSFNTMLAALQESRLAQHRLVMDASHELRTPLTSLRTNIEVLQRAEGMAPEDREALLADVDLELRELTALVEELVELATDQRGDEPLVSANLGDVAEGVVERARRRTGRPIHLDADKSPATVRIGQVERAITNLLDNADKWSPPGVPIEVAVHRGEITVRDRGPGIPAEDLPFIFERFYRADVARTLPGSGLGLAIVAQVADTHEGGVRATNRSGGGAAVSVFFPTDG
jgi:two-component system sensor histidine kinase MprB